jgi:Flp pilus assembly protein TadG
MTFALLIARARRPLRRFLRDKRGVSAVEFAMLLPLMVTLYLGGAEVSQAIAVDRKVTLTARTLADLVAQTTSVNSTDIANILAATTAVVAPFDDSKLKVTVSSVIVDAQLVAKIKWSDNKNGTVRAPGTVVTVPDALKVSATYPIYLVWAESEYTYTPTIGYVITGPINLKDQLYMRPRLAECVLRTGVQTAC